MSFNRLAKPGTIRHDCIGGLMMVDLLLFNDYAINPAEVWRVVVIRLGVFTPRAAMSTVISYCQD